MEFQRLEFSCQSLHPLKLQLPSEKVVGLGLEVLILWYQLLRKYLETWKTQKKKTTFAMATIAMTRPTTVTSTSTATNKHDLLFLFFSKHSSGRYDTDDHHDRCEQCVTMIMLDMLTFL